MTNDNKNTLNLRLFFNYYYYFLNIMDFLLLEHFKISMHFRLKNIKQAFIFDTLLFVEEPSGLFPLALSFDLFFSDLI